MKIDEVKTTAGVARDHALAVRRFALRVVGGPNAGAHFTSAGQRVVVGTHPSCELALSDPTVSRFHCELTVGEGAVVIRDLGSKNATRLNGVALVEARFEGPAQLALGNTVLELELQESYVELPLSQRESFGELVGRAPPMRAVFAQLERAAASDATVLLTGETGTGKELAARAIHDASARSAEPFVVIDYSALPHALIHSELFGHERGSFTGADSDRQGSFELAHGGTVFLDEIGELPADIQPKLLRVLERREVHRIGAAQATPIDVRIIAATNRNLTTEVNAGRFRADLYYRLAVVEIKLPALRERIADLPLLVEAYVASRELDTAAAAPLRDDAFLADLERHAWPGNVRELRNYLERSLVVPVKLDTGAGWEAPPQIDTDQKLAIVRDAWTRYAERRYIIALLDKNGSNVTAAARAAGTDRAHFYRIMAACGLPRSRQ